MREFKYFLFYFSSQIMSSFHPEVTTADGGKKNCPQKKDVTFSSLPFKYDVANLS